MPVTKESPGCPWHHCSSWLFSQLLWSMQTGLCREPGLSAALCPVRQHARDGDGEQELALNAAANYGMVSFCRKPSRWCLVVFWTNCSLSSTIGRGFIGLEDDHPKVFFFFSSAWPSALLGEEEAPVLRKWCFSLLSMMTCPLHSFKQSACGQILSVHPGGPSSWGAPFPRGAAGCAWKYNRVHVGSSPRSDVYASGSLV